MVWPKAVSARLSRCSCCARALQNLRNLEFENFNLRALAHRSWRQHEQHCPLTHALFVPEASVVHVGHGDNGYQFHMLVKEWNCARILVSSLEAQCCAASMDANQWRQSHPWWHLPKASSSRPNKVSVSCLWAMVEWTVRSGTTLRNTESWSRVGCFTDAMRWEELTTNRWCLRLHVRI